MAGFETFDLGRVIQTAEGIKALRRQEGDDLLRRQYMQTNIAGAQQQQDIQKQQFESENQARTAKTRYLEAGAILQSSDPIGTAKMYAPELIQKFNEHHGEGAFEKLQPEQVKQMISQAQSQLAAAAGIQPKVKYIDLGGQQIAIDENTGHPLAGAPPLTKTATPDSMLSAQTSTQNAHLSAGTAIRGQDLAADTAAQGRAVTMRGQDMTAAAAGGKITETQGNAKAFGLRATQANVAMEHLISPADKGGGGYDPLGVGGARDMLTAGNLTTNWMASAKGQQYQNLAKAFVAPILRKESGAAISDSEWTSAKQLYIPWPGDSKEVLGQKAENRRNAIQGIAEQAGPGGIPPGQAAPITATGPNGAKLILQNGQWTPAGG